MIFTFTCWRLCQTTILPRKPQHNKNLQDRESTFGDLYSIWFWINVTLHMQENCWQGRSEKANGINWRCLACLKKAGQSQWLCICKLHLQSQQTRRINGAWNYRFMQLLLRPEALPTRYITRHKLTQTKSNQVYISNQIYLHTTLKQSTSYRND